jgi:hypothetical protein
MLARLGENSTWRGLVLLVTSLGVTLDPEQTDKIVAAGLAVVGVINVFRKAPGSSDAVAVTRTPRLGLDPWLMLVGVLLLALMTGCASFSTTQTDESENEDGTIRKITTRATARTFWQARSDLASFAATQTDKTQSAKVGSLKQESYSTNATRVIEAAVGAAVNAAVKTVRP